MQVPENPEAETTLEESQPLEEKEIISGVPPAVPENMQPQSQVPPQPEPELQSQPPAQVVTPVVPVPQQQPSEIQPATLSFLSPNVNPKLDQEIILHLRADNAAQIANAFLFFEFDPSAVQIKDILQGAFMTPGAFAKSFDNGRGTININATHVPTETTSGVVATIVLIPTKPGQTTIKLNSAVLRTENASVIPVTFVPYTIRVE
jgi:hypothetical protein